MSTREMTALVVDGPNRVEVRRVPMPSPGPNDVLVRVTRCGVCGTDLGIVSGAFQVPRLPLVIGHESAGIVVAVGDRVSHVEPDQAVAVNPIIPCGTCHECRRERPALCDNPCELGIHQAGAMAEYVVAPTVNVHSLPRAVTPEAGALVEPLACAIHGQDRAGVALGDTVVVIGGGFQGLLHALLAQLRGAGRVIMSARHERRRERAAATGADLVLDPDGDDAAARLLAATGGRGADVVVEASGSASGMETGLRVVAKGGRLLVYGALGREVRMTLTPFDIFEREISIVGSIGGTGNTWPRAIELIASGRLDPATAVDAEWELNQGPAALEELRRNRDVVKGVVRIDAKGGAT